MSEPEQVIRLKAVMRGISPMIWRRFEVAESTTLWELHEILEVGFGWDEYLMPYLHAFTLHGVDYGDSGGYRDPGTKRALSSFELRLGERFTYAYNFIAGWKVDLRVEHIGPPHPRRTYPRCTTGARAAPPSSCQNVDHYLEFLDGKYTALFRISELIAEYITGPLLREETSIHIPEEVREELEELKVYTELEDFDRAEINRRICGLTFGPDVGQQNP